MKKALSMVLVGVAGLFAGCSGSNLLKDGVYTARADDRYVADKGYGWRDTLTLTIQDGQVTGVVYDAFDAEGNAKSVPGNYKGMDPLPEVWIPELSGRVLSAGLNGTVDRVAGATMSSNNVQKLLAAIQENGKPGETIDVAL